MSISMSAPEFYAWLKQYAIELPVKPSATSAHNKRFKIDNKVYTVHLEYEWPEYVAIEVEYE